jgi:hypothetical protein
MLSPGMDMQRFELPFWTHIGEPVDAEAVTGPVNKAMTDRRPTNKADHLRFPVQEACAIDIAVLFRREAGMSLGARSDIGAEHNPATAM